MKPDNLPARVRCQIRQRKLKDEIRLDLIDGMRFLFICRRIFYGKASLYFGIGHGGTPG